MVDQGTQFSRDNLIGFFDFVVEKGLMKKNTALSYKKACSVILKILDEAEAADLSRIELEAIFQRHRNLAASKIPPKTLKTYEIRVRAAVGHFIEYTKDPSSWKPGVKQRTGKTSAVKKTKTVTPATKPKELEKPEMTAVQPSVHIDFQIHISPEAKPEQIDQIFASMREHLYPKQND